MSISIRPLVFPSFTFWCALPVLAGVLATTPLRAEPAQKPEAEKPQKTTSESVSFDLDMLKGRGIDFKLAEYFAQAPRFREGTHMVTLFVNGARKGLVNATFDSRGELIFDHDLLSKAELVVPDSSFKSPAGSDAESPATYDFIEAYPSTIVELRPGKEEVHLILPTDALRAPEQVGGSFSSGGTAAILNYNLLGMNSEFAHGKSEFRSVDTVAGFNAGDWIVRSRQTYTSQDDKSKVEHLYAYGQKTITGLKSIVQGGQINIANSIFSGDAITGVQIVPEAGLRRDSGASGAVVEGIAYSTARVEVRQNSALIHTAVVPAGPFTLSNFQLLSGNSDLDVTVIEADGSRQTFTVPAADLGGGTLGATPGYSFAVGQYRPYGDDDSKTPALLTGTGTWQLDRNTNVTSGLMGASGYQAAGWAVDHALTPTTNLGIRQLVSSATEEGARGTQVSASLNTMATDRLSLGLSATRQSEGYRDLVDTTYQTDDIDWLGSRYRDQYSASVGWSDKTLGGFRLSHSYSTRFDGQSTQRLFGSWSKSFKHASVSLNVQKTMGETDRYGSGDSIHLSVSVPLGGRTLNTYVNTDRNRTRTGATLNEQVNDNFGYRLQAERDNRNQETDMSAMVNILPRYAQATLGYSRSGSNSTTYNGSLIGGIVAHDDGITFSPYSVDDTFSILSVGDVPGVKISTPQGPVWTDYAGKAVAPSLQAFSNNRLEVSPKTLPRNVDILNGFKEIQAGRGSVNRVDFGVVSSRRILMTVKGADGKLLDKGLSVFDGQNQYLTSVTDRGQIFLPNIEANSRLTVSLAGGKSCLINYTLAEKADVSAYFETVDATCTPI